MKNISGFSAQGGLLNIGHRGAASLAPENTLWAAQKALEAGADMWELDVRMAADGELVLLHDPTLNRTSNAQQVFSHRRSQQVTSFTLAELHQLDFGLKYQQKDPFGQIAAGVVSADDLLGYADTRIPTLQEALAFTCDHNWQVNIEIEHTPGHTVSIVAEVVALIEKMGINDQVLITSFHHRHLLEARAINPRIATGVLDLRPRRQIMQLVKKLQVQFYLPRASLVTAKMMTTLQAQGVEVAVWTVNEPAEMQKFINMGVSGIITDFPQRLSGLTL